jgi:hypothetical protein
MTPAVDFDYVYAILDGRRDIKDLLEMRVLR